MDERRATEPDAEKVDDRRGVRTRHFRLENRLLDRRGTPSPPLGGPVETEVARVVQLSLESAPKLDQPIRACPRVTDLFAPRPREVGGEPCAEFVSKPKVFGG